MRVASVLQSLNAEILSAHGCLFGGGTAIVLSRSEYRESVDIDFLISDKVGFRELRQMLSGAGGISSIVRSGMKLSLAREIRADHYGVRTMFDVGGVEIKFEIILEARIDLESPSLTDKICGVSTLTEIDMGASKFLANSDRFADDSVFSRDLIDLAMLDLSKDSREKAIERAVGAYGDSILKDLSRAIENLKKRRGRLEICMSALKMESLPESLLWQKIRKLIK